MKADGIIKKLKRRLSTYKDGYRASLKESMSWRMLGFIRYIPKNCGNCGAKRTGNLLAGYSLKCKGECHDQGRNLSKYHYS